MNLNNFSHSRTEDAQIPNSYSALHHPPSHAQTMPSLVDLDAQPRVSATTAPTIYSNCVSYSRTSCDYQTANQIEPSTGLDNGNYIIEQREFWPFGGEETPEWREMLTKARLWTRMAHLVLFCNHSRIVFSNKFSFIHLDKSMFNFYHNPRSMGLWDSFIHSLN